MPAAVIKNNQNMVSLLDSATNHQKVVPAWNEESSLQSLHDKLIQMFVWGNHPPFLVVLVSR
jgi:hypothetical protein